MVFRLWRIPTIILRFLCFLLFKPRRVRSGYGDADVAAAVKRWKAEGEPRRDRRGYAGVHWKVPGANSRDSREAIGTGSLCRFVV